MVANFNLYLVSFLLHFSHSLVSKLKLVSQVVQVPFESLYLADVVLLLLLEFLYSKHRATSVLLHIKALLVKLAVLILQLLQGVLVTLRLYTSVSVVL